MSSTKKTFQVNIEGKNLLAKLLAAENIWVRHSAEAKTASFNMVDRILTLPVWEEMDDDIYNLLIGHEIAHALYDEHEDVRNIAKRIDPKNVEVACDYWNVVADARGERLVTKPFPGLKGVFSSGYRKLFDRNFFGTKGTDLNSFCFLDKVNLHFKVPGLIQIEFTPEQQALIDKVAATISQADVVEVAKEIYQWCKKHEVMPQGGNGKSGKKSKQKSKQQESGEDESDDNGEEASSKSKGKGKKSKKSKSKKPENGEGDEGSEEEDEDENGNGNGNGDEDENDEGEDENGGGGDEEKDGKDKKDGNKTSDGKDGGNPDVPPPSASTQHKFDEEVEKLADEDAEPIVYVTLPVPNLKNIIEDYTTTHKRIRAHQFSRSYLSAKTVFLNAEKEFNSFRAANLPKINYIFQQFEMRKQADRYQRTRLSKVGSLDTLRLYEYKTTDDIFRSVAKVADGKNHGLIFIVDWSGSMSSSMAGTLEQLIVLCLFCRKANIPFEVYSLTIGGHNAFSSDLFNLCFESSFKMRNYLSSRMTSKEFTEACVNLFALMPNGTFSDRGPVEEQLIGCTPLDEAIVTTIDLMKDFRNRTHTQVVNAVFLTDGGANTVNCYLNKQKHPTTMYGARFLIDDRQTHKTYDFSKTELTPTLLRVLHDRQNIHVVGFYIGGYYEMFFDTNDSVKSEKLAKQYAEDGYVISTEWGYDELYITNPGDALKVKEYDLKPKEEAGSEKFQEALSKKVIEQHQWIRKQRMMLDRFVIMIA